MEPRQGALARARKITPVFAVALFFCLLLSSQSRAATPEAPDPGFANEQPRSLELSEKNGKAIPNRYIVVLRDSVAGPAQVARAQVRAKDGELGLIYRHALKGYSAQLSKADAAALTRDPRVKYVTPDRWAESFEQTMPTGVGRIFAPENETLQINEEEDEWVDADVAVIDTGIDNFEHPELNVAGHTICIPVDFDAEVSGCQDDEGTDGHYHGTHVAGTIGAVDDDSGVVGVAPGARLWGVKVLDDWGGGAESWIIAGVDWVTAHAEQIEVANMSLGCGPIENKQTHELEVCEMSALEEAIDASIDAGVVYVVAAGNAGVDAEYASPAHNPDVITVSALADYDAEPGGLVDPPFSSYFCKEKKSGESDVGLDDTLASFSNYGELIDIAAPGVCIISNWHGGDNMGTISGTSMAAPHVAGAAAILASKANPEDREDVEAITATILAEGNLGWTDTSGDGTKEPLLDLSDESAFDAKTVAGEVPALEAIWEYQPTEGSGWLHDVSCVTLTDCLALRNEARSAHWDGSEWSLYSIPKPPGEKVSEHEAAAVSCASAEQCMAAGYHGLGGYASKLPYEGDRPASWLWDGETWSFEAAAAPGAKRSKLNGVSCPQPDFCVGVGWKDGSGIYHSETLIEHWDDGEWSIVPSPNAFIEEAEIYNELTDVSCASTVACLAVGRVTGFGPNLVKALVLRWDGSEWTEVPMPSSLGEAQSVSCAAADSCVVLDETARAAHWDGENWSLEWLPRPLEEVSCTSATACLAVGGPVYPFGTSMRGEVVRWNGSRWTREAAAAPHGEELGYFSEILGVSCLQAPVGCVVVGASWAPAV